MTTPFEGEEGGEEEERWRVGRGEFYSVERDDDDEEIQSYDSGYAWLEKLGPYHSDDAVQKRRARRRRGKRGGLQQGWKRWWWWWRRRSFP